MLHTFDAMWRERTEPLKRVRLAIRLYGQLVLTAAAEWMDVAREFIEPIPRGALMDTLLHDVRSAFRAVRRDAGLVSFAVLIIGLGVGASTAVFSVMSPLMLRPLPFAQPDRLVWIANGFPEVGMSGVTSRTSNLMDFRELATSFEGMTGYNAFFEQNTYTMTGDGEPERLNGVGVAQDFLDVLGVEPHVGRNFVEAEGVWDGRPAVILTHDLWQRRYAADPTIVGTSIRLNDMPTEIVGVLPESFDFSSVFAPTTSVDILIPFPISAETDQWGNTLSMIGRLAPGATIEGTQGELDRVIAGLQEADPDRWGLTAVTTPLQQQISGPFRSGFLLLAAAAFGVMLIVCVNLSNLLLAKAPRRMREMAIRSSLGATRPRLLRQLMTESLILSLGGAFVGLLIAIIATRFVAGTSGISIPMLRTVSVDGLALLFTAVVAIVAGIAVGVVPALQISRGGEAAAMGGSGRGNSSNRKTTRIREGLVVAEVALACVLLVFGGLLLKSFQNVLNVDLGFDAENAVTWHVNPTRNFQPWASPDSLVQAVAYFDQMAERIQAIPGVEMVGLSDAVPLGRNRSWSMSAMGVVYENGENPDAFPHLVDHRYLDAMGIEVLTGRGFTQFDNTESENVVVVNETAAQVLFQEPNPLGRVLALGSSEWRVIGVVEDVRHQSAELGSGAEVYFPYSQNGDYNALDMVVRADLPLATLVSQVRAAMTSVDPAIPTRDFQTLDELVDRSLSPRRFTVTLLGAFAASALLLAALGIYGVLSYSVTERTPEIGIRMALGETGGQVLRRVVGRTLFLSVVGIVFGGLGAFLVSRAIRSLLYGVEPGDPMTFAAMAIMLVLVAVVAGLRPAMRAARTDPMTALQTS